MFYDESGLVDAKIDKPKKTWLFMGNSNLKKKLNKTVPKNITISLILLIWTSNDRKVKNIKVKLLLTTSLYKSMVCIDVHIKDCM